MQNAPYREVPIYRRDGSVKALVKVSPEDHALVMQWRWGLRRGYAARDFRTPGKRHVVKMHRLIMGLGGDDERQVDHVSRDKLDNRRSNLRVVTHAQQSQNVPARVASSSPYRGVSWDSTHGVWVAQARCGHKRLRRVCTSETEAAAVALAWRREHMPFATD